MRLYETAIVIDSQLKNDEIEDLVNKFSNFITNHGGEIVEVNDWGKKRLAYEVNKRQYGYYVFIRFNGPGQIIILLEREYRLNENVLRFLTLAVDKRALKLEEMQRRQEEREQAENDAREAAEKAAQAEKEAAKEAEASDEGAADENEDAESESSEESQDDDASEEEKETKE